MTAVLSQGKVVKSLIAADEYSHSRIVKGVGAAFSPNVLREYESLVDESAHRLIRNLAKRRTLDLQSWLRLFAMDVLYRVVFSESPGFLDAGGDVNGMLATTDARAVSWHTWGALPNLEYWIHKNPIMRMVKTPSSALATASASLVMKRKAKWAARSEEEEVYKDMLHKYLYAQVKYPNDMTDTNIIGLTVSSIGAGSDTVAVTLTTILFLLLKHPDVQGKLEKELHTAVEEGKLNADVPGWNEVHQLPYLEAVVKESMRYRSVTAFGLDRIVPKGGAMIAGRFMPGGTIVACHNEAIHRSSIYGTDTSEYRPERWTEASVEQRKRMEQCFLGFSQGKRMCLGRNLAMLEIKKLIPLLLLKLDVSLKFPML